MTTIEYYYNNPFPMYNSTIQKLGIKKGNKDELLDVIKNNPLFCRDQKAIEYDYFVEGIEKYIALYIKDNENIVGCATIYKGKYYGDDIEIIGICVPISSEKKYGTLLLNKIKEIANKFGSKKIGLSAKDSNKEFYLKNGFLIDARLKPEIYSRGVSDSEIDYDLDMSYTLNKTGGKKRKTNKKRNNKSKTRKNQSKR